MNNSQRIPALKDTASHIVEIKTIDNPDLDREQMKSITVYEDSGSYYLASDFEQIKLAIIEAVKTIINLGNNYRHPLYFDVQIVPGDEMDCLLNSTRNRSRVRRKRKKK